MVTLAGPVNAALKHAILIIWEDGDALALSLGETDPDSQGNKVILAYQVGTPPTSYADLRPIAHSNAHGGRAVRDVATIEVK
jgi:hypothetical protein